MSGYLFPGVLGLLLGLLLHWTGFDQRAGVRSALGLRRSNALRSGLTAVGWSMALTALLCWLAVIDVDTIAVLPLSLGTVLGGVLLGVAAGLCGFTPSTAFAGLGGGSAPLEALCVLAGCGAASLLLPSLEGVFSPLRTAAPYVHATLFEVTLDEAFLLGGGFLGQASAGAVLIVIALCIPSPKPVILTEEDIARQAASFHPTEDSVPAEKTSDQEDSSPTEEDNDPTEETASSPEDSVPTEEDITPAEDAAQETIVVTLPEEEPLVIDTGLDEDPDESDAPSSN